MISRRSLAIFAVLIVGGLACGTSTSTSYGGGTGGGGTPPTGDVLIVSGAKDSTNRAFNPNPFTTALNGTASASVIFANQDNITHTVTQDGASPTFNHSFGGGTTFTFTFTTAGTYTYHCSIHPTMVGSITVNP